MSAVFLTLGGAFGAIGVGLGAFGAHALRERMGAEELATFELGVRYQLIHSLALVGASHAATWWPGPVATGAGWAFAAGIVLFSGSLFALAGSGVRAWGAVTPFGGVLLVAGWLLLVLSPWL